MQIVDKFNHSTDFKLSKAILLYENKEEADWSGNRVRVASACAATLHDVTFGKHGRPCIQPGQPASFTAIEALARQLAGKIAPEFFPANLLSASPSRLVWWCPGARRRIWFKPNPDDKQAETLKALNGQKVFYPPLLFVARRGLHVYALVRDQRPTINTRLYRAPFWNLSDDGGMCRGNLKLPEAVASSIPAFEKAFFNSAFSHSSGGKLTRHPGGHSGLWRELAQRKTKPDHRYWSRQLVRTHTTINSLLHD